MDDLTRAVLEYQRTGRGLDLITSVVAEQVYWNKRLRQFWDEDLCSAFLVDFYPRIRELVERFTYHGKPFDAYVWKTLQFRARGFICKFQKKRRIDKTLENISRWNPEDHEPLFVCEPEPELTLEAREKLNVNQAGRIEKTKDRKRVLFLAFREADRISDAHIHHILQLTDSDDKWFYSCLTCLRELMSRRNSRRNQVEMQRSQAFLEICLLHERINQCNDAQEKAKHMLRVVRAQQRLNLYQHRIMRIPASPTHKEIAEIMGVPKGTVDSGLYYLLKKFNL